MKFYRRQSITDSAPMDNKWAVDTNNQIITDTKVGMQVPRGDANDRSLTPENGSLRYNTQLGTGGELEVFINGTWEIIKTNRQQVLTRQTFTSSNYLNTIFGPLAYGIDPSRPEGVAVYVENVYQIPETNYTLKLSTPGLPLTTSTIVTQNTYFGETVVHLNSVADFNPGLSLAGTNLENNVIVETDTTNSTITIFPGALGNIPAGSPAIAIYSSGTYVQFTPDAVPAPSKPITTILGLDGFTPPFEI